MGRIPTTVLPWKIPAGAHAILVNYIAFLDMAQGNTGGQQFALKGGASNQEKYKIILPQMRNIRNFFSHHTVFPHTVLGKVGGNITIAAGHRLDQTAAYIAHFQNGAGLGLRWVNSRKS